MRSQGFGSHSGFLFRVRSAAFNVRKPSISCPLLGGVKVTFSALTLSPQLRAQAGNILGGGNGVSAGAGASIPWEPPRGMTPLTGETEKDAFAPCQPWLQSGLFIFLITLVSVASTGDQRLFSDFVLLLLFFSCSVPPSPCLDSTAAQPQYPPSPRNTP